jgi:hypothetical protein
MGSRLALAVLILALLGGCGTLHCQEESQNSRASGACALLSKF